MIETKKKEEEKQEAEEKGKNKNNGEYYDAEASLCVDDSTHKDNGGRWKKVILIL